MADALGEYDLLRERARAIAVRLGPPEFYRREAAAVAFSRECFDAAPLVAAVRARAAEILENDYGHGLPHATKVALDAGALVAIEAAAAGASGPALRRRVGLAQCAGLLHDIRRKNRDHAAAGAQAAAGLLAGFPLSRIEIEDICAAIRNHEAFQATVPVRTREGALLSDCLYDADKFRWGPDNFTDTLWAMVAFARTPPADFVRYYPRGMQSLARIRDSFRTPAGRTYGPQFIDLGLAIGEELYRLIQAGGWPAWKAG
jgi:hypothetical protein